MVASDSLERWLRHRIGEDRLESRLAPRLVRKGLELNTAGPEFIDTFGRKEFEAIVGFLDIIGYSTRTMGMTPSAIADYLATFINVAVEELVDCHCLVDKVNGDEVMFVLANREAEGDLPFNFHLGQTMDALHRLYQRFAATHPFRLGLAVGNLTIQRLGSSGYGEWTTIGETVNLAKRLLGLPRLKNATAFAGAFGCLHRDNDPAPVFEVPLAYVTLRGMRWRVIERIERITDLKGVSPATVAIFE